MRLGGGDRAAVERALDETDRAREAYVRHFYRADARDPALYHLTIDSTALPLDAVVELIVLAAEAALARVAVRRTARHVFAGAVWPVGRERARSCSGLAASWAMRPDGTAPRAAHGGARYECAVGGRRRDDRWRPTALRRRLAAPADARRRPSGGRPRPPRRWRPRQRPRRRRPTCGSPGRRPGSPTRTRSTETPTHVWVSPDERAVAYDQAIEGDVTTVVDGRRLPRLAAHSTGPGRRSLRPSWIGNGRLLLSRDVSCAGAATGLQRRTRWDAGRSGAAVQRRGPAGRPASTPAALRAAPLAVVADAR